MMTASFLPDLWGNYTVSSVMVGHKPQASGSLTAGLVNKKWPSFFSSFVTLQAHAVFTQLHFMLT